MNVHSCAIDNKRNIECWGYKIDELNYVPTGMNEGVSAVSSGGLFSCAIDINWNENCWGGNMYGQIETN